MALTPEDVVNKRFQHVKFRDGYDQDEVDDFLDEVVVELRRLYQENDELRQKLSAAELRVTELEKAGPAAKAEDADATQAMPAAVAQPVEDKPKAEEAKPAKAEEPKAPAAPVVAPQTSAAKPASEEAKAEQPAAPAAAPAVGADNDAHGLIALAQRVHDEHVAEGEKTRDKLIADAKTKADGIVAEAQKKRDETLAQLETQKANLEKDIDGLQNFERQYRTRLKSYLTDQLRDLENSGSLAPETLGGKTAGQSL